MQKQEKDPKPKDYLGIKVVSEEYAYWDKVRENTKTEIENLEKMLKFNKAILDMCEEKLKLSEA